MNQDRNGDPHTTLLEGDRTEISIGLSYSKTLLQNLSSLCPKLSAVVSPRNYSLLFTVTVLRKAKHAIITSCHCAESQGYRITLMLPREHYILVPHFIGGDTCRSGSASQPIAV